MYEDLIKKLRNRRVCVQGGGDLETDFPIMREAADAIEQLRAECQDWYKAYMDLLPTRWYSVEECLPEPYTWVLVSVEKHEVAFNAFYDGAQWKDAFLNGLIVTHWMPLPTPPKEETE
jgi:hypothetical protein